MKAAIYTRISSDSQEEGTSLDTQRQACLAKAEELGYEVPGELIFRETYSGLELERPMLEQLRELVRGKQVNAVICYCLDRLSRDPIHFIILQDEVERAGAKIILVTDTLDSTDEGKLITHIKGYSAKLEALKIRDRCLRGLKERAREGKLVGGRSVHLFGYTYERDTGKRAINEEQAPIVRDMFKWLAEGGNLNGVTYRLTELGIPTPTGKSRWNTRTVYKILTNPAYIGKPRPYHGIDIVGSTPALISEELFNQVQKRLKSNMQMSSRNTKIEFLLRGHILCGLCQRKYYASRIHQKDRYYYCSGRLKILTSHKCDNKTYQADYLEGVVWEKVEELLTRPEIIMGELERRKDEANQIDLDSQVKVVEKRLAELDREQEELLSLALKGFPDGLVVQENAKINQYRDNLKTRLAELSKGIADAEQTEVDIVGLKHFCELASRNLANFTFADKRLALDALRLEVRIDGENISISGAVPAYDIASTQLKPSHREWLSLYYHKSPYIF